MACEEDEFMSLSNGGMPSASTMLFRLSDESRARFARAAAARSCGEKGGVRVKGSGLGRVRGRLRAETEAVRGWGRG